MASVHQAVTPARDSEDARWARITWVDWLRVLAVLGVFLFHAVHPWDEFDWHIKAEEQSVGLTLVQAFFATWGIAFFFLIAGAGTYLAMRWRSARSFARERALRLLVPFAVVWAVLGPVQSYLEETFNDRYHGSFLAFVPTFYWNAWYEMLELEGPVPIPIDKTYHLWFLVFLFEFAILAIPVAAWLRGQDGRWFVRSLSAGADRRGWVLLLGVPFAVINIGIRGAPGDAHEWVEFGYYLTFFLAGYVLMSSERLLESIRRDVWLSVSVGAIGFAMLGITGAPDFFDRYGGEAPYTPEAAWYFFGLYLQAWAWTLAALGLGMRLRRFGAPVPHTLGATTMPFFLLHQPVILAGAFVVISWDLGPAVELPTVVIISFAITAVLALAATKVPGLSSALGVKRAAVRSTQE
jgi:glucans biosynthesis protein C